jgi:hypothetical protein
MGNRVERIIKGTEVLPQRGMGVQVKGRADLLCYPGDRHVFTVKLVVFVLKVMHVENLYCLK